MTYTVKELFYSLQGEGYHSGRPAIFCRFAGCNLWSGREQDRATAVCNFCDTDFVGSDGQRGGKFTSADELATAILQLWPASAPDNLKPFVVFSGGEPALQLDQALTDTLHRFNAEIAIETNGTVALNPGIDWVCVSPKADATLIVSQGDELKLVYPQPENTPEQFTRLDFRYFYLQPMDGPAVSENTQKTIDYCLQHPQWNLSIQSHKVLGID